MKSKLTLDRLKEVLSYDSETGEFTRLKSAGGKVKGPVANVIYCQYLRIQIDGHRYYAHRLAWFYVYGKWPKGVLDHINQNKLDNRISNLREATVRGNNLNVKQASKRNRLGIRGISIHRKKFRVRLGRHHLGVFDTAEEASKAYEQAREAALKECLMKAEHHSGTSADKGLNQ